MLYWTLICLDMSMPKCTIHTLSMMLIKYLETNEIMIMENDLKFYSSTYELYMPVLRSIDSREFDLAVLLCKNCFFEQKISSSKLSCYLFIDLSI